MILNLETDYAIRIVHYLAEVGERRDAGKIAEKTGVTLRFSLKILRKLVAAGIIRSYKGAGGGYELARPGREITLGEVIEVMSGSLIFSHCQSEGHACSHPQGVCYFKDVFDDVSDYMRKKFDKATF
mgnify:CR=1 FL=1